MAKARLLEHAEFLPVWALSKLLPHHDWDRTLARGARLGRLLYAIPPLRSSGLSGLRTAFGREWDEKRIRDALRSVFEHLGMVFAEFLRLGEAPPEEIRRRYVVDGIEHLWNGLKGRRGVVLATGHIGNWEMNGTALALSGIPMSVIVRPLDNRILDRYVESTRERVGMEKISRLGDIRPIFRALQRNRVVVFLSDQNSAAPGVFVPFFGKLASTVVGPSAIARRTGAPLIVGWGHRMPDGTHRVVLRPPIEVRSTGNDADDDRETMARVTALFEEAIRSVPEQWLWLHPRWRKRPPEETA
jgi:KDO2-lipid IV(A) lauroyltransferase